MMKYLSHIFMQNGGICRPILPSYKDPVGKNKASTNITVTSYNGRLIHNTRLTDYLYVPLQARDIISYIPLTYDGKICTSHNAIGVVDDPGAKIYELIGHHTYALSNYNLYKGLEDVRLVEWNGILYGIGFRPDVVEDKVIAQLIEYNEDLSINCSWFLNTDKAMEKNWQPVEGMPFTFMYDPDTSSVLVLDIEKLMVADDNASPTIINNIQTPEFTFVLSGSTQLIKLEDNRYISICHTGHKYIGPTSLEYWTYNHYFVVYDEHMNRIWTSEPFHFVDDCMEFTCGMCHHDDDLYISFTMYDGMPHIMSIPFDTFRETIYNMMNDPTAYEGDPNTDYMVRAYNENEICGAAKIPYMFYLENIHRLNNCDDVMDLFNSMDFSRNIYESLILYFITRMPDNENLRKRFRDYIARKPINENIVVNIRKHI